MTSTRLFKFKFPSSEESMDVNREYEKALNKAKDMGIMESEMMSFYLKKFGIFTAEMEKELKDNASLPEALYPSLPTFKDKRQEGLYIENAILEIIRGEHLITIEETFMFPKPLKDKERQIELTKIKSEYMRHTVEGIAEMARSNKLTYFCTYDALTNKRVWPTYKDFLEDDNRVLVIFLGSKLMEFLAGLSTTLLRKLARHQMWRTKWISAIKTGTSLFKGEISEWDTNKAFLCYWSNFYDSIYGAYEAIEDHIVNDDRMLDSYLEAKARERKLGGQSSDSDPGKEGVRGIFSSIHVNPVNKK